jgi:hypothetical protein
LSQFYPGYNPTVCEKQFHYCRNGNRKGITIKTFFQIAKEHGISLKAGSNSPADIEHKAKNGDTNTRKNRSENKIEVFYSPVYGKDNEGNTIIVDVKFNYRKFIDLLYSFGFRRFDPWINNLYSLGLKGK